MRPSHRIETIRSRCPLICRCTVPEEALRAGMWPCPCVAAAAHPPAPASTRGQLYIAAPRISTGAVQRHLAGQRLCDNFITALFTSSRARGWPAGRMADWPMYHWSLRRANYTAPAMQICSDLCQRFQTLRRSRSRAVSLQSTLCAALVTERSFGVVPPLSSV